MSAIGWEIPMLVAALVLGLRATTSGLALIETGSRNFQAARNAEATVRRCAGFYAFERNLDDAAAAAAAADPNFAEKFHQAAERAVAMVSANAPPGSIGSADDPCATEALDVSAPGGDRESIDARWRAIPHWESNVHHPAPWPNTVARFVAW